jgi:hypothetical protein
MNFFEAVVGGWHHIFSARMLHAKLWTQDAHFEGISGVSDPMFDFIRSDIDKR